LVLPGGLKLRLNNSPNVFQIANATGLDESFEVFNVSRTVALGTVVRQHVNINAKVIPNGGDTWESLDPDTMNDDGGDYQRALVCITSVNDKRLWTIDAWRPTPTKIWMRGVYERVDTVNGRLSSIEANTHRVIVNDTVATTPLTTFNGQSYYLHEGWLPHVAGHYITASEMKIHGSRWILTSNGKWGLHVDTSGSTIGNHQLDLVFRKYPLSMVNFFGSQQ
jgi:hypothetical protein